MNRDVTEAVDSAIEKTTLLKKLGDALRSLDVRLFLESPLRPLKNFLNGSWLEHPLHPLMTDIPVGAWTVAMLLDLLGLVAGVPGLGVASGVATGLGIAGAAGAVGTGLMDQMDTDPPEVTVAFTHGAINIVATLLFAVSFVWRWIDNWDTGWGQFILSAIGYVTVAVGAYLGGSLVYRQGVMVNRNAYRKGPKDFVSVLPASQLAANTLKKVDANGQPVLLFKQGDQISAIGAVCSHYGAPLEEGKIVDGCVECPWHYSLYSLSDGSVKRGPTTSPVPAYETRVSDGQIQVRLRK